MPDGAALLLAAALLAACGGSGEETVLVSAAASLSDAFADVEKAFEAANPGVDVALNLAASSTLREQIVEGAPADVFASADLSNMDRVVAAGAAAGEPQVFARNHLQIAVPDGNPAGIVGLADFADEDLVLGLCAEGVPCGEFGRRALERAGVTPMIDTEEPDVRALLTKVETGELDAGIVYATDVLSSDGLVDGIDIPAEFDVVAEYPIVALSEAPDPDAAATFVAFALSAEGRAILASHGFATP
ncbi:MAG: molybdate ABC transporter substrate-binding protein [Actinobacteria bacterium]|nr:MAG: molybdate ABC transporter substrate-binding protein [Actinomycetota bacterium]